MDLLVFLKLNENMYNINVKSNGKLVGVLVRSDDGMFYFSDSNRDGAYWPAHVLSEIVDKLDELNEALEDLYDF
jgi:hypothetical protein